jgi:hypothetical protein
MSKRREDLDEDLKPQSKKKVRFAGRGTANNDDPLIYRDDFGFDHPQDFDEEVEGLLEKRRRRWKQGGEESDDEEDNDDIDDMFADDTKKLNRSLKRGMGSLAAEELEGEEEGPEDEFTTIRDEDDDMNNTSIRITPFNLREEMDEGYSLFACCFELISG